MSHQPADRRYDYKFVRYDGNFTGGPTAATLSGYQDLVHQFAGEGWRLVQIFAPATPYGTPFWELIFERPVETEP